MDTPYERLDADIRDEWRQHPGTVAFLGSVRDHYERMATGALDGFMSGCDVSPHSGGYLAGLRFVLDLPVKGKTKK